MTLATSFAHADDGTTLLTVVPWKGQIFGAWLRDGVFLTQPIEARMPCAPRARNVRHAYASACGRTNVHGKRLWLFDVDEPEEFVDTIPPEHVVCRVPSRKGFHVICRPHHATYAVNASLHKDNPTNLYIPG